MGQSHFIRKSIPQFSSTRELFGSKGDSRFFFAIIAALILFIGLARDGNPVMAFGVAFGVFITGIISGVGLLAFAELFVLFVKLEANTQYICERLDALEHLEHRSGP